MQTVVAHVSNINEWKHGCTGDKERVR